MSKELKKDLFNIYDVIVFEDENGITQDCVCVIGKERIIDEIVDVIECNNHSISIYENDSYRVWEKEGKNGPYCATNKKIIHLYTLKNDNRFYEIYPTNDYGTIDNTKSSEALNELYRIENNIIYSLRDCDISEEVSMNFNSIMEHNSCAIIKNYILKAQEQAKEKE